MIPRFALGIPALAANLEPAFADRAAWDALVSARADATVFAGPLLQTAHELAAQTPAQHLVLRQHDQVQSVWPLWQRRLRPDRLGLREIGFARNPHTLRNHLLLPDDSALDALTALLLACKNMAGWDTLAFDNLPQSHAHLIPQAAKACGLLCDAPTQGRQLLWADIQAGFDAYLATRSGQFRRQLRKREREISTAGHISIKALSGAAITGALPQWRALTNKSWQGTDPATAGLSDQDWAFHAALAENGRLWLLALNDHPIAFLRMLEDQSAAYVHTMHYDPAFADHAPGNVLFAAMMADAAQRGLRRVDFNGNTAFFARWATAVQPHQNWRLYRPGLAGNAMQLARAGLGLLLRDRRGTTS